MRVLSYELSNFKVQEDTRYHPLKNALKIVFILQCQKKWKIALINFKTITLNLSLNIYCLQGKIWISNAQVCVS